MQQTICILCLLGILLAQLLIGGARLVFSIPGYLLVALAGLLVLFLPFRRISSSIRIPAIVATLGLIGYTVIRTYFSPIDYLARPDRFMAIAALVVYLLTATFFTTAKQRFFILFCIFGFSLLHITGGVLQFARNDNFMFLSMVPPGSPIPEIFRGADYGWRASGFYVCPNHLAGLLEILALLALARCFFGRTRALGRTVALYFALAALAGLALTGSRGGYLSIIGGLAAMLCLAIWSAKKLRSRKLWIRLTVAGVVLLGLLIGCLYLMSKSALIDRRLEMIADTKNMRILMWAASLKQFQLSPLFGTGAGTYLYYGRQFRSAGVQNDPQHVHNDYLELLCEYGIVGSLLFLVFLSVHLFYGFKTISAIICLKLRPSKRFFSNELALLMGAVSAIVALSVHSVVDFNCHVPGNVLFYAFLFGILATPSVDQKVMSTHAPPVSRGMRIFIPSVSAVLIFLIAPLIKAEYHTEWARVHLRNQLYYRVLSKVQTQLAWSSGCFLTGFLAPATGLESGWVNTIVRDQIMPQSIREAEAGLATEKFNPDLYYYLGEARHFIAVTTSNPIESKAMMASAGDAYYEGLRVFPYDARLQMKLGRTYDNLGLLKMADEIYQKALSADPNLGNLYAQYGYHLSLQRKITRAEGYYRRALQLDGDSALARAGLQDIQRIRSISKSSRFKEEYGELMDSYDLEPPTSQDEARGVVLWTEQE